MRRTLLVVRFHHHLRPNLGPTIFSFSPRLGWVLYCYAWRPLKTRLVLWLSRLYMAYSEVEVSADMIVILRLSNVHSGISGTGYTGYVDNMTSLRRGLTFSLGALARNVDEVGARIGIGFGFSGADSVTSEFSHFHT